MGGGYGFKEILKMTRHRPTDNTIIFGGDKNGI